MSARPAPASPSASSASPGHGGRLGLVRTMGAGEGRDEDVELVERAKRGDRVAFATLFKRHHGRIVAMCARLLRDPIDVEDAVQQSFLEAWRCLYRFEGKSRFTTWLTRIAIHTCFSARRRVRRLLFVAETAEGAPPAWAEPNVAADDAATHRAHDAAIKDVLASLSPKKRTVFVLSDLEGMSSTEIAEILDVPDATVRTRLFHARKELAGLVRAHPVLKDIVPGAPSDGGAR